MLDVFCYTKNTRIYINMKNIIIRIFIYVRRGFSVGRPHPHPKSLNVVDANNWAEVVPHFDWRSSRSL